jgi:superfamily II DNA or RNA helicase
VILSAARELPALVVVHTKELLKQTHASLEAYLQYPVGMLGAGYRSIQPVTVATAQTLATSLSRVRQKRKAEAEAAQQQARPVYQFYDDDIPITDEMLDATFAVSADDSGDWLDGIIEDYLASVRALIIDETHHARANTIQDISRSCVRAVIKVGVSGTPFRDKGRGDDMEVQAYLGPLVYRKSLTEMVNEGYLVQPVVNIFEVEPDRFYGNYRYTVDQQFREIRKHDYNTVIQNYICNNPYRDNVVCKLTRLLQNKYGMQGIVLVGQKDHGRRLASMIEGAEFICGDDVDSERQRVINAMLKRHVNIVVATTILQEGVDIPPAQFLVHAHPRKSFVAYWQANGRVLRPYPNKDNNQKKQAVIVDLHDQVEFLKAHGDVRADYLNQEPGIQVKRTVIAWDK